jgi:hypothetical protein
MLNNDFANVLSNMNYAKNENTNIFCYKSLALETFSQACQRCQTCAVLTTETYVLDNTGPKFT